MFKIKSVIKLLHPFLIEIGLSSIIFVAIVLNYVPIITAIILGTLYIIYYFVNSRLSRSEIMVLYIQHSIKVLILVLSFFIAVYMFESPLSNKELIYASICYTAFTLNVLKLLNLQLRVLENKRSFYNIVLFFSISILGSCFYYLTGANYAVTNLFVINIIVNTFVMLNLISITTNKERLTLNIFLRYISFMIILIVGLYLVLHKFNFLSLLSIHNTVIDLFSLSWISDVLAGFSLGGTSFMYMDNTVNSGSNGISLNPTNNGINLMESNKKPQGNTSEPFKLKSIEPQGHYPEERGGYIKPEEIQQAKKLHENADKAIDGILSTLGRNAFHFNSLYAEFIRLHPPTGEFLDRLILNKPVLEAHVISCAKEHTRKSDALSAVLGQLAFFAPNNKRYNLFKIWVELERLKTNRKHLVQLCEEFYKRNPDSRTQVYCQSTYNMAMDEQAAVNYRVKKLYDSCKQEWDAMDQQYQSLFKSAFAEEKNINNDSGSNTPKDLRRTKSF